MRGGRPEGETMKTQRAPRGGSRFWLRPIGRIRSTLTDRTSAPKQGSEGAPDAWLEGEPWAAPALESIGPGDALLGLTRPHRRRRGGVRGPPRGGPRQ